MGTWELLGNHGNYTVNHNPSAERIIATITNEAI